MSLKVFKPQLKSDFFLNLASKNIIPFSIFFGLFVFIKFYFLQNANIVFSVSIGIFFFIFSYYLCFNVDKRVKKWDLGGPVTIKIDTSSKTISLDKITFGVAQINYVDVEENKQLSSLVGFHLYYSVINATMNFYLKDGRKIAFHVQNATHLKQIIKIFKILNVDIRY